MHVKKRNSAVTLLCSPRNLILCHLERVERQLHLKSFHKIPLNHLELEKVILFNPTRIVQQIKAILPLGDLPLFISLYGPSIKDRCIDLHTAHPTRDQLPISHAPQWQWDYCYLYPYDHSYYFYLCGIPRGLIFQWQLLALREGWNMHYITSERMALLQLYKYMFGSAFRPTQLGLHLQEKNNNIDALFSRDDLARILETTQHIDTEDVGPLLASCGLFVAGEQYA